MKLSFFVLRDKNDPISSFDQNALYPWVNHILLKIQMFDFEYKV